MRIFSSVTTKNLKTMDVWVLCLIYNSSCAFLLNVKLNIIIEILTISPSSMSSFHIGTLRSSNTVDQLVPLFTIMKLKLFKRLRHHLESKTLRLWFMSSFSYMLFIFLIHICQVKNGKCTGRTQQVINIVLSIRTCATREKSHNSQLKQTTKLTKQRNTFWYFIKQLVCNKNLTQIIYNFQDQISFTLFSCIHKYLNSNFISKSTHKNTQIIFLTTLSL